MKVFEVTVNDKAYSVELCTPEIQVYSVSDRENNYIIAKDFKGIWIELHHSFGAMPISLSKIGFQIEEYFSMEEAHC